MDKNILQNTFFHVPQKHIYAYLKQCGSEKIIFIFSYMFLFFI